MIHRIFGIRNKFKHFYAPAGIRVTFSDDTGQAHSPLHPLSPLTMPTCPYGSRHTRVTTVAIMPARRLPYERSTAAAPPTLALAGKGRHGVTCSQNKAGAGCGKQKRMKHQPRRHPILLYNHSFFPKSLLSDSNQRPRDYKSRALAN